MCPPSEAPPAADPRAPGGEAPPRSPGPAASDGWGAWDRFLEATPAAGFMQASWWAEFRLGAGFEHFGVVLKAGGAIAGGAVVLRYTYAPGRCFYYIPEGPALPAEEAAAGEVFAALLAALEAERQRDPQRVSHLRIEPRWERLPGFVRGFRAVPAFRDGCMEPRSTLCIDLRPPEEAILAQMKPKGRYNIRLAQRHGVAVVEDPSAQGRADFLRIYGEMAAAQGLRPKSPEYFQRLLALLAARRQGSLFFAEYQGLRLATALVVYFGRRATYLFGGSVGRHRHVMAPYRLHFEIMRQAKARGLDWYDLWGVAPGEDPAHPWRDISVFKRKFGGVELTLVPTLDYVYDPAAYAAYAAPAEAPPAAAGRPLDPPFREGYGR